MENHLESEQAITKNSHRLLIFGGCALAFGAAFANVGLVLQTGTSVSHLTGDISKFTINATQWAPESLNALYAVSAAAVCFLLGAMLAGVFVHHPSLDISRPYGRSITSIGILFFAASMLVTRSQLTGIGLAAIGCGFQNALATHYRGIILRTTHLTGMFTDLGISLGMKIRGHSVAPWKIIVPASLILSFCAGGFVAAFIEMNGIDTIKTAGIGYFVAGLSWSVWKHGFLSERTRG